MSVVSGLRFLALARHPFRLEGRSLDAGWKAELGEIHALALVMRDMMSSCRNDSGRLPAAGAVIMVRGQD